MSTDQEPVDVPPHVVDYLRGQNTLTLATASPGRGASGQHVPVRERRAQPLLLDQAPHDHRPAPRAEPGRVVRGRRLHGRPPARPRACRAAASARCLLSGEQIARVADLFGQKFPDLSPGATMSISFFRVTPTEIEFIDNTGEGADTSGDTFGAEFHRERSFSVFADLPAVSADAITATLQSMTAEAGEVIVREGGPADKFFIVVEGEVKVTRGAERDSPRSAPATSSARWRSCATSPAPRRVTAVSRDAAVRDGEGHVPRPGGAVARHDRRLRRRHSRAAGRARRRGLAGARRGDRRRRQRASPARTSGPRSDRSRPA